MVEQHFNRLRQLLGAQLVSTARIALPHVAVDAFSQLLDASGLRLLRSKHRPMDIFGAIAARAPDDYRSACILPRQDRAGADAQLTPHIKRD